MDIQSLVTGVFEFRFIFFVTLPGVSERYTTSIMANSKEEASAKFNKNIPHVDKARRIEIIPFEG